jgi:hypothetical protein
MHTNWLPIIAIIVTFIGGGLVGNIATCWFNVRQSRKARRSELVSYLQEWRSEIANADPVMGSRDIGARDAYKKRFHEFHGKRERACDCFHGNQRDRYIAAAQKVVTLERDKWNQKTPQIAITEAIDELLDVLWNKPPKA